MTAFLRAATGADIIIGPFLDASDGVTPLTALTISGSDVRVGKAGTGFAASLTAGNAGHLENGYYSWFLDANDVAGDGELIVAVHMAGALPVWHRFQVLDAATYDALVEGSGMLDVNAARWNGANVATPDTAGYPVVTVKTGIGAGEIDLSSGAVKVAAMLATALADLFDTDSGATYAGAVAGSVVKEIADNAGGSALTVEAIADAVWDEAIAGHLTAGSTGEKLSDAGSGGDPLNNQVPGSYASGTAGALLGRLSTTTVNLLSVMTPDGDLNIVAGDDYTAAINRPVIDLVDTENHWPDDLTGATVTLRAEPRQDGPTLVKAGTVVVPTGSKRIMVELTSADTAPLNAGQGAYEYQVEIAMPAPGSEKITAQAGNINVRRRVTA